MYGDNNDDDDDYDDDDGEIEEVNEREKKARSLVQTLESGTQNALDTGEWYPDRLLLLLVHRLLDLGTNAADVVSMDNTLERNAENEFKHHVYRKCNNQD